MSGRLATPGRPGWVAFAVAALLVGAPAASASVPAHGRVWELVTSSPTNGVPLIGERAWSPDGDRVVYASFGPTPGSASGDLVSHGLATRGPGGWTDQAVGEPFSAPHFILTSGGPLATSTDLSTWLWATTEPLVPNAPPASDVSLYLRASDGGLSLLGTAGGNLDFAFVTASEDLRHAVFASVSHLLPADAGRTFAGDAYERAGTELRLVGVDSSGTPFSACGSQVGDGDGADAIAHPVSRDGTRIFFAAPPAESACVERRGVYLREDGSRTTEISASHCSRPDCDPPQNATFAGATPDGSSAFLFTGQQLTNDDVDSGVDLYRYDVADDALTRISAGVPGAAADVSGVIVLASDDGTRVYFLATGELVAGAGEPGRPSLYLSDRGHLRFIAGADDIDLHAVAMTSDGRTLAFTTAAPLLPSDADGNLDLYRYDAATHGLEEVSVGLGDRGNEAFDVNVSGLGVLSSPFAQSHPPFMSADGSRILFATGESLVPEDANQAPDVYERADGDLGLITSGTGDDAIAFGGISADGRSVFFTTDEALLPADRDQGDQDLYVARLGGGFPALAPPSTCEGEACQGAPGGTLRRPDPASLGFVEPPPPARIHVHPLGRRTARRLAATGRATIVVDVPVAGRISVVARTRIDGQATVVAHDAATARGATSVRLHLRLAAAARRLLQRRGTLSLKLVVRHSTLGTAPVVAVRMRRAA